MAQGLRGPVPRDPDKIFAHKSIDRAAADALMANTNVDEVKELLGFLHALYQSLSQLHMNGIKPDITPVKFDLPPAPGGGKPVRSRVTCPTPPLSSISPADAVDRPCVTLPGPIRPSVSRSIRMRSRIEAEYPNSRRIRQREFSVFSSRGKCL